MTRCNAQFYGVVFLLLHIGQDQMLIIVLLYVSLLSVLGIAHVVTIPRHLGLLQ